MNRILDHVQFCGALIVAVFHAFREAYYRAAIRHVGLDHPDAWLLTQRQIKSQLIVNDFLRRTTSK